MRKTLITVTLIALTAGAAMAGNPDVCKRAAHLEHMCQRGVAKCQAGGSPAECSQTAYDCYVAEALLDTCDSSGAKTNN